MPSFIKIVQAIKKLNSISRARLNFLRRPFLCTTLYRNLMQAGNFAGTFDQLFLWMLLWNFHRRCLSPSSIPWCKKSKMTKNSNQGGGGPALNEQNHLSFQKLHILYACVSYTSAWFCWCCWKIYNWSQRLKIQRQAPRVLSRNNAKDSLTISKGAPLAARC